MASTRLAVLQSQECRVFGFRELKKLSCCLEKGGTPGDMLRF